MPFLSPSALASAMPSVMPMSSTVWCASISRSPLARTARSIAPWRAIWSSMWSRKGMPDSSFDSPLPSRSSATKTWVSLVSRWTSALRMVWADRGERLDEFRVLVGGADREPQAVCQQWMRAVKVANQYTTALQRLHRAGGVGETGQDEVRGRGVAAYAGEAVQRRLEARALGDDRLRLRLEHLAAIEQQLRRRGGQGVHVVGRAQLLQLGDPVRGTHGEPEAKPRQPELRH